MSAPKRTSVNTLIRPARSGDAESLRLIYNHAAKTSTATMDTEGRSPEQQRAWLETHNGAPYPALVAEVIEDKTVIGYAALSLYNPKPGYARTAETSVYLHQDWRGTGIGRALLNSLIEDARKRGFLCLVALITADNEASLRLHRRCGFTDVGTMRRVGEKFGKEVDVTFLQMLLDETN
ncbi:MAG: N-acetyltransferase family protein [Armatimonadota bacterium]